MASIKLLSWNIENFKGKDPERLTEIAAHIHREDPDLFCLFEVENVNIIELVQAHFKNFIFNLTEGPQNKEILVAYNKYKFQSAIYTQRRSFQIYNPYLRPGALLSLKYKHTFYNFLFLHADSGVDPSDFGNRTEVLKKVFKLKKSLDKKGASHLVVAGDLNTMGMFYPSRRMADVRVSAVDEIQQLAKDAGKAGMRLLTKQHHETFNNGKVRSDLDHVLASKQLKIRKRGHSDSGYEVKVWGWNQLEGDAQKHFIRNISDHSALVLEILPD